MTDAAPAGVPMSDAEIKLFLVAAAKAYISANAGPFTAEVLAYVEGTANAQVAALTANKLKITL